MDLVLSPEESEHKKMTVDPEARICGVCGRVLEQLLGEERRLYRHAQVDEPTDHPPVAVRPDDVPGQARYRCDFCLAEPITHTLVVDRQLGIEHANIMWDAEWAMCAVCTEFVLKDDWLALRRHAFASFESRHGPIHEVAKQDMRVVYAQLRQHLVMIYAEPDDPERPSRSLPTEI